MPDETKDLDGLLEQARNRFKRILELEAEQRKREADDLLFQVPERQWTDEARAARDKTVIDGVPVPARPCLSVPKLDQPIQLVLNQQRSAHLGVNIHPLSPDADEETAETLQGIYRQIERDSRAHLARSWAFDRAVKAGRGRYRITTRYADEAGGHPLDQVIRIERILHQECVYWDPAAQEPDYSDARYAFITSWVPAREFERMYPDKKAPTDGRVFEDTATEAPEWVQGEGDAAAVLVAEHFYFEHETEELVVLEDGSVVLEGEVPKGAKVVEGQGRQRDVSRLMWCKMTGVEVLEGPQEMNGKLIPIVEVFGRELQPVEGKRVWYGMVHPAKDAQRTFNYSLSTAVEVAALEPKAPWVADVRQTESFEDYWKQANIRNFPVLPYNATAVDGVLIPPPQRTPVDAGRLGPSLALVQQADQFIQASTATFNPALGNLSPRERSGRAIQALQQQGDAGNSDYLDNLVRISMPYEARVVLDLIPRIYDRPGRLARVLDLEDKSSSVMLGVPFVTDPKTKRPMAVPPQVPPPPNAKTIDLSRGIYSVDVSIGRSYQTRLEQGGEEIGRILEAAPNLMPMIGDIYFKYRDFPGANELAKRLEKIAQMSNPALKPEPGEQPSPEQMTAMLQQLKAENDGLKQALAKAAQALETDEAKQRAGLEKAQMDNETRLVVTEMQEATKRAIAQLEARVEQQIAELRAAHEVGLAAVKTAAPRVPMARSMGPDDDEV